MSKKEVFSLTIVLTVLVAFFAFFLINNSVQTSFSITGFSIKNNGTLEIQVLGSQNNITIYSPLNQTYEMNKSSNYFLPINVSANFDVAEWKYSIYSLRHNDWKRENQFLPNPGYDEERTIEVYRWGNKLVVSAREGSVWYSEEVYFYVQVPNSPPIILPFQDEYFLCENKQLSQFFYVEDIDEDLVISFTSPSEVFYSILNDILPDPTRTRHLFFSPSSRLLGKGDLGTHVRTIVAQDVHGEIDSASKTVHVIEVNNLPRFVPLLRTTTHEIWDKGDDSSFVKQAFVDDTEDGNSDAGNLVFNISFGGIENLFEIDNFGWMNYTPATEDIGNNYNITICVTDNALDMAPENISLCFPQTWQSHTVCDWFELAFTDRNRPPILVNYSFKDEDNLNFTGLSSGDFWAEFYDPDGNNLYVEWYVNGVLKKSVDGVLFDEFNYLFPCDVSGVQNISVVASDGLENVSYTWEVLLLFSACPIRDTASGGSGGGGGFFEGECEVFWACKDWNVCQNAKKSRDGRVISPEEYTVYRGACDELGYDERFCGFQIRNCFDSNGCNVTEYNLSEIPKMVQVCYFTENPSCFDGIKNCHSGGCEVLVDCGGPCSACSTCSDGIQNQGEEGIDCGGPCPNFCEPEYPMSLNYILVILSIFLIISILWIIYKVVRILKYRRELRNKARFKFGRGRE